MAAFPLMPPTIGNSACTVVAFAGIGVAPGAFLGNLEKG